MHGFLIIPIFVTAKAYKMQNDTQKKRGRPRKSPNDTTTAPYVKKEPIRGRGRPPKNPHPDWGGAREGAGRPALPAEEKLPASEFKSATITIRVSPVTRKRYDMLKDKGADINEALRKKIDDMAKIRLGPLNIPDNWTPPKK